MSDKRPSDRELFKRIAEARECLKDRTDCLPTLQKPLGN